MERLVESHKAQPTNLQRNNTLRGGNSCRVLNLRYCCRPEQSVSRSVSPPATFRTCRDHITSLKLNASPQDFMASLAFEFCDILTWLMCLICSHFADSTAITIREFCYRVVVLVLCWCWCWCVYLGQNCVAGNSTVNLTGGKLSHAHVQ
jgi:hypothetical protein